MMEVLISSPVSFINSASHAEASFVVFCGTWLGMLALAWAIVYLLFRNLPGRSVLAPLEHLSKRFYNISFVIITVGFSYIFSVVLKNTFEIGRPALLHLGLHPLLPLTDYGFPSSHAAFYSALATSMLFVNRRAGIYLWIIALIVGAARVFAGVHTPLDIFGGYLLGIAVSAIIGFISERIGSK